MLGFGVHECPEEERGKGKVDDLTRFLGDREFVFSITGKSVSANYWVPRQLPPDIVRPSSTSGPQNCSGDGRRGQWLRFGNL